jgi:Ca-activated chloride channel homolog
MKIRSVALWAVLGVVASSAGAMAIPVPPTAARPVTVTPEPGLTTKDASHFTAGQTLLVDGRLGHASIAKTGRGETYFFAQVTGADAAGTAAAIAPLNLAIVIDRSGSMKGDRIANAITAAAGMVERMRDGDSVTVVSFDTQSTVVVPPTLATASSRPSITAAIRSIRLGGDTCISCGLDEGMRQLDRTSLGGDRVNRMILLSDGATNHGIRDIGGLRGMAGHMRDRGLSISTIGVDVDFDEKVMAAIAAESNGRHYFVANPSGLPTIFAQEFDSLLASVAADSELSIELPPGVEVDQVFDRTFRREGAKVIVPFGTFSAKQEKTVLMKLRVPADREGLQPVVDVKLTYRDLLQKTDGSCAGSLAVAVTDDASAQKELDPFVAARLERSRTAQTLTDANLLFEQGRVTEARARLRGQREELEKTKLVAQAAATASPFAAKPSRGRSLGDDFDSQQKAVAQAEASFAAPPANKGGFGGGGTAGAFASAAPSQPFASPPGGRPSPLPAAAPPADSREGKAARKDNQQNASDLAF